MRFLKQFKLILVVTLFFTSYSYAENECFEKISRSVFKFNESLDRVLIGPLARGYNKLPTPVKNGTGNFTSNIATLLSIPNKVLQKDISGAADSLGSFMINSTVGIFGLADVASSYGIKDTKENLAETLGVHGVKNGCYYVLPVLGPTTIRDSIALIGDTYLDPFATMTWRQKEVLNKAGNKSDYLIIKGTSAVDFRGDNDKNFESLRKNSIDLYAATKSLYLQNQNKKIKNISTSDDENWKDLD